MFALVIALLLFAGQTRRSALTVLAFFVVFVGANRCVRPVIALLFFVGQTHRSAPTMLVLLLLRHCASLVPPPL